MNRSVELPAPLRWSVAGRAIIFILSATSIWSLLADFYGLWSMRVFTTFVLLPASAALIAMALIDYRHGDRRLFRALVIGALGGLYAACSYDLFRIPFVVAAVDHVGPLWIRLPLFKVFPRFGAMILGHAYSPAQSDSQFPLPDHLVGWTYHFSNGITFGVMYMALIGDARRRRIGWAMLLAAGLEAAMLFTPYMSFFGIPLTTRFVVVTLTAHLIFGGTLGIYARSKSRSWQPYGDVAVPCDAS